MAKKQKRDSGPSLSEFSEENLLDNIQDLSNFNEDADEQEEEIEEELEEDEEEIEEEEEAPKKQVKKKPVEVKKKKEEPIEEEEEEEEVEDESEEDEEETEKQDPSEFWKEVDNITGVPVEVEYGELDPLSPQGVALREKALAEQSVADFIDRLAEKYPTAYKAVEYALAGGDIQELFKGEKDYSKVTLREDDEDHAKLILAEFYEKKGIKNPDRIKRMIAAEADSEEGLIKAAQGALDEMKQSQEAEKQEELIAQQAKADRQKAQDQQFLKAVDGIITGLKLDSFRIGSRKEAEDFSVFVKQHVQRDGKGGYLFVTPIEPQSLEKQLQAEYFRFKKGDLDKLIAIKATSQNVQKLRLGAEKDSAATKKTAGAAPKTGKSSMRDYEV